MATAFAYDPPAPLASFRRTGDCHDTYCIWVDDPLLRVDARGFFDMSIARSYCTDIKRIIAELRETAPRLRVIVDRSETPTFDVGVAELLVETYRTVLRAGDRVALIVDTSMTKGPIRRIADREETQVFLSNSAARTWVLAYD